MANNVLLFVETRWLYIYEILVFIDKFNNDIQTILLATNNDELFDLLPEIIELIKIIKPLRFFCDFMEKNQSLCCVGQYIQEIITEFKQQTFIYIQRYGIFFYSLVYFYI